MVKRLPAAVTDPNLERQNGTPMLSPHLRVADVLEWSPLVTRLLFEMRVGCIGCGMNKFCTLEDLCARHGLDLDRVSFEILDAINKSAD